MRDDLVVLLFVGVLAFASIATLWAVFSSAGHLTSAIATRFGRLARVAGAGIRAKIPFVDDSATPYGHKHRAASRVPRDGGQAAKR